MHRQAEEDRISVDIAELPSMNKAQLLKIWERTFPTPPPAKLRKELMVPILAYRMQEAVHGGMSQTARTRLQRFAQGVWELKTHATGEAPALIGAIVKSRGWLDRIVRAEVSSQRDLAAQEGYDERYVSRLLPLAFLSPEIRGCARGAGSRSAGASTRC